MLEKYFSEKLSFKCVQQEDNVELEAGSVNWRFAAISEPKGGAHIVSTGSTVLGKTAVKAAVERQLQERQICQMSARFFRMYFLNVLFGRAWAGVGAEYVSSSNQSNGSLYCVSCIRSRVSKFIDPPKSNLDFVVLRLRVQKK